MVHKPQSKIQNRKSKIHGVFLMTTALPAPHPPPRAKRALKPPSDRDLEIYTRVKIKGFEQWEVAQDQKIHYSRVSQIVKRVTRWLAAGGCPSDPLIRDHAARQRLARTTLKMRLMRAIENASMALEFPLPVETTRRRVQGLIEIWREESTRTIARVNLSALRMLIDATQALQKLEEDDETKGVTQPTSDEDILRAVFDLLCGLRARAEAAGRLSPSSNVRACVADSLTTLLGADLVQVCPVSISSADQTAQEVVPTAQVAVPSPQVTFPTAQELLNFSAPLSSTIDTNTSDSTTSSEPPTATSLALEPFDSSPA
jgi:hypothetical protein